MTDLSNPFVWEDVETAVMRAVSQKPLLTLEACLQKMFMKKFFQDMPEATMQDIAAKLRPLTSGLHNAINKHINDMLEPLAESSVGCESMELCDQFWDDAQGLVTVIEHIAKLKSSITPTLDLFHIAFHRVAARLLECCNPADDQALWLFDECNLKLCNILIAQQGINGLQLWRKRLCEKSIVLEGANLSAKGLLHRSMHYMSEKSAHYIWMLMTRKFVQGQGSLPQELVDMVLRLTPYNTDTGSSWQPVAHPSHLDRSANRCCVLADAYSGEYIFWSANEHRYVHFHISDPLELETAGVVTTDFLIDGKESPPPLEIWVRCLGHSQPQGVRKVNNALCNFGPLSSARSYSALFEVDHGVTRDWRQTNKKAPKTQKSVF